MCNSIIIPSILWINLVRAVNLPNIFLHAFLSTAKALSILPNCQHSILNILSIKKKKKKRLKIVLHHSHFVTIHFTSLFKRGSASSLAQHSSYLMSLWLPFTCVFLLVLSFPGGLSGARQAGFLKAHCLLLPPFRFLFWNGTVDRYVATVASFRVFQLS